ILEVTVDRAVLDHEDLPVPLENRGLDFPYLFVEQHAHVFLAVENLLPRLADAVRAEGVRLSRPAEHRLGLLVRFQQPLLMPFPREGWILTDPVQRVEYDPRAVRCDRKPLFDVLVRPVHRLLLLVEPRPPATRLSRRSCERRSALSRCLERRHASL